MADFNALPFSVDDYSTVGGTVALAFRVTMPSVTFFFYSFTNIRVLILKTLLSNSLKRIVPLISVLIIGNDHRPLIIPIALPTEQGSFKIISFFLFLLTA